jgi:hypothetical protein
VKLVCRGAAAEAKVPKQEAELFRSDAAASTPFSKNLRF